MPWSELDIPDRVVAPPKERAKDSKASDIHLSEAIDELPRIAPLRGKPAWLFPVTCERPAGGCWYLKAQVGQAMEPQRLVAPRSHAHRDDERGKVRCRAACRRQSVEPYLRHNQGGRRGLQRL